MLLLSYILGEIGSLATVVCDFAKKRGEERKRDIKNKEQIELHDVSSCRDRKLISCVTNVWKKDSYRTDINVDIRAIESHHRRATDNG